ncbi:MAG TPA: polyprenyl synthetase family protein [Pyrinomonadaceae bacterium]|nr:polyprenyl synthetase family protein [Pyrinomonadaceae bacterium]
MPVQADITLSEMMLEIEREIRVFVQSKRSEAALFREMVDYHFGWNQPASETIKGGKKIRPLLVVLAASAVSGQYDHAMPAATGLQIIHDFTLVLDDIMDQDRLRRHRPTLWTRWGINHAMTTGTGLYTLGFSALTELFRNSTVPNRRSLAALDVILSSCMETHDAQIFDLSFEETFDVPLTVCTQTACGRSALIACAAQTGALLSTDDLCVIRAYETFGRHLATAYSIYDDYSGIWGNENELGKPVQSDIRQRKKTFPVMVGYHSAAPATRKALESIYSTDIMTERDVREVVNILESAGAPEKTLRQVDRSREAASAALDSTGISNADQQNILLLMSQILGDRI